MLSPQLSLARTPSRRVGLALLLLAIFAPAGLAQEDEDDENQLSEREQRAIIVGLKANARDKNALVRAASARDLPTLQCVETMEIGHELLADDVDFVRNATTTALAAFEDEESIRWLAGEGLRKGSKTHRARVVDALGLVKATELVEEALIGELEHSYDAVQAAAVIALANQQIDKAMPRIAELADSSSMDVREAVARAIGTMGTTAQMDAMRKLIKDEDWEVRAAMISACARLAVKPVVSLLVARLSEEDGRLRKDLRDSLVKLTGEDFGFDPELWVSWWNANKGDYGVTEKIEIVEKKDDYASWTEYHGIKIYSTKVVFILDTSESMGQPVASRTADGRVADRDANGHKRTYKGTTKLAVAQEELTYVIQELGDNVYFNILSYNTEVEGWKPGPVKASAANKTKAVKWLQKLQPKPNGATNIYQVLMDALGVTGKSTAAAAKQRQFVDSIYFLADGLPTYGHLTDPQDILREVKFANPDARVQIHTLFMGDLGDTRFMSDLAGQNGGEFVHIH